MLFLYYKIYKSLVRMLLRKNNAIIKFSKSDIFF